MNGRGSKSVYRKVIGHRSRWRSRDIDWVGLLRHIIWSDFTIKYVKLDTELRQKYNNKVPRKDLGVFITAMTGGADYLISNDEDFREKASQAQLTFSCITPKEFLEEQEN